MERDLFAERTKLQREYEELLFRVGSDPNVTNLVVAKERELALVEERIRTLKKAS